MAITADSHPTLVDVTTRMDPDGSISAVSEILEQTNEILEDMVFMEGNLPTGHRTTIRTGLPVPTWHRLYGGVQPTKSQTAQITDTIGMMEAYAEVDKRLADLNGNTISFRSSEDKAHVQGMAHDLASTVFVGNEDVNPEKFNGLNVRFDDTTAGNGDNVILGGSLSGQTDNASIWLIGWGDESAFGLYPKGSQAGLQISDKGQVTIENADGSGGRMEGYRTHFA